ncbi:DUF262 domain-containing protein [Gordonia spumicola]|uniref:DUF262 domain-containing protein n=1 Tax=Gordonia spumicola TaxID=589161 RepID=UPI003530C88C
MSVTSRSIERAYRDYREGKYVVNRRYQRKLVWTVDEKRALIDSVIRNFPLPQFLVAESRLDSYEIIDGMQRLNSIFSFLENEFSVDGGYFDLESIASTKELLDSGELQQKMPLLPRTVCVAIASYELAQSEYLTDDSANIEDVFRRINSSGRKLSRHDLRQAGTASPIADTVRKISSAVRGIQLRLTRSLLRI